MSDWIVFDDETVERILLADQARRRRQAAAAEAAAAQPEPPSVEPGAPAAADGGLRLRRVADVEPRAVAWLVPGLLPRRAVSLLAGVGGLGKSTLAVGIAAGVSAGRYGEPGDAILVSYEDPVAEVLRPRLQAAGADLSRVHVVEREGLDAAVSLPGDLDALAGLVRSVAARLLVVDPIVAALDGRIDSHKDQHVRRVLARLARLAEEHDLAVLLIGHLNKAPARDAYLRVGNSVAFWNGSRTVLLLTGDGDDEQSRLLALVKGNWASGRRVERWRVESVVLPDLADPRDGRPIETSRLVYVGPADDVSPDDVLAPAERGGQLDEAREFLRDALGDGPRPARDLLREAREVGLAEVTVRRASKSLGVVKTRTGFGPGGGWSWSLPIGDHAPSPMNDHLWGNRSTMRDSGASETPIDDIDDHVLGTDHLCGGTEAPEPPATGRGESPESPAADAERCPICGGTSFGPISGACRRCGFRPWEAHGLLGGGGAS